jgi:membrane-bound lytic murein transglycosylase D
MKKLLIIAFTLLLGIEALSQDIDVPQVPSKMKFADIDLKITESARREIQSDVDALTASSKFFYAKVNRSAMYMPIVEQVFEEEGLPKDFKYLAIQESGFISDAVSSSNAVGFWQFKKLTADEVGLRVDRKVDERQNIVSASRGAAKYLQKNNFYFNNWLYALQAYQMGAGGAMDHLGEVKGGEKKMTIDKKTYWYVKKYLAHKVAFQDAIETAKKEQTSLKIYDNGGGKTLEDIGGELQIDPEELHEFNTWLLSGKIPEDKTYPVIIPTTSASAVLAQADPRKSSIREANRNSELPSTGHITLTEDAYRRIKLNGLQGVITNQEMTVDELADLLNFDPNKLISYNDVRPHDRIIVGQIYYLQSKRGKARIFYHTVQEGETVWMIAQNYGVKMPKLIKMNRLDGASVALESGRILWLKKTRPENTPIEYWPTANTGVD